MRLEIRDAAPGDGVGMAVAHVSAWQHGYAGILPAEYLDGLDPAGRAQVWDERLARLSGSDETDDPLAGTVLFVAVEDSDIVGVAMIARTARTRPAPTSGSSGA